MPRRITHKSHDVYLSDHAWLRYCERTCVRASKSMRNRLTAFLKAQLNESLGTGLHLDKRGDAWLEIGPRLWASARLDNHGWIITTVIVWDESKREVAG